MLGKGRPSARNVRQRQSSTVLLHKASEIGKKGMLRPWPLTLNIPLDGEATRNLEVPTYLQWSFEPRLSGPRSAPYNATNLQSSDTASVKLKLGNNSNFNMPISWWSGITNALSSIGH
jgi:hypothetical protein